KTPVLGINSFGKGTVQQGYPLGDGSRVWVTVQTYKTPSNIVINGVGIKPDFEIPFTATTDGTDPQLEEALRYVRSNRNK
ncbi:MAG: S41 family peptidase, partial [bacterium]|nr:S41 family peptidase [bacterium]